MVQFICGITSVGFIGSAMSYAVSYNNNPSDGIGVIDFYFYGELTSPVRYLLFVGVLVTVVALVRLLSHIHYLKASVASRALAIADLLLVVVCYVFILAGVIVLPRKLDLFGSYDSISPEYTKWVFKLKDAWVFILLAKLLWIASLVIASIIVKRAGSQASTLSSVPPPDASKNMEMGGNPTYPQANQVQSLPVNNVAVQPQAVSSEPVTGPPQAYK